MNKDKEIIPEEITVLVTKRKQYRKDGLWREADEIRGKIREKGYEIKDTKDGQQIIKI